MKDSLAWVQALLASIREAESDARISPHDLRRLLTLAERGLEVAEQSKALLANAYSMPDDDRGMRFLSQDAVKLQLALREMANGEDSVGSAFTV
ncbi:MAG: hypothetical protein ACRD21_15300 [Vicinamibacteria bacterium]